MRSVINEGLILVIVLGMCIASGDRVRDFCAHVVVWVGCFFIAMQLGQLLIPGITAWTWPFMLLIAISVVVSGIACYLLVELAVITHRWVNRM